MVSTSNMMQFSVQICSIPSYFLGYSFLVLGRIPGEEGKKGKKIPSEEYFGKIPSLHYFHSLVIICQLTRVMVW